MDDFIFGTIIIILIGVLVFMFVGLLMEESCDDACTMERRMAQVQWCVDQEVLTRSECVILAGSQ